MSEMSRQDNRLAISIKNQCTNKQVENNTNIYKLPLVSKSTFEGASSIIKRFSFGEPSNRLTGKTASKTILLMGATGSGKTTWINAMVNYVLGVEWEDDFRFKLVNEVVKGESQAHSQTQEITAYDLHFHDGFRIPFSLTIVDSPGFGDTQGIKRDKEITTAVQEFFNHQHGIQV
jgi:GTP-binding protein EngB required for normal cell division